MHNKLIDELAQLTLKERNLVRCLNMSYNNLNKRIELFKEIDIVKKEIGKVKFKLRMEKELYENRNPNSTKN